MKIIHVLVFLLALSVSVNAAVFFKVKVTADDFRTLTTDMLSISEVSSFIGSGNVVILYRVGGNGYYVTANNGVVSGVSDSGSPQFTISASDDAVLSILNSVDKTGTVKALLAERAIIISASDGTKQAAINAALASGLLKPGQITIPKDDMVYNKFGAPIGYAGNQLYAPPSSSGIFFSRPPGVLAQFPGLIYDTVSKSPNAVGPWNIFKINPGLIGPNQILALNPGLVGPADIALLNPNLHGPAEFAYVMGIGAHSNSARLLQSRGMVNDPSLGPANRWGNKR